jgi:sugar lactone lactonase YvrE
MKYGIILLFIAAGCISIKPTERITFTATDFYPEGIAYDKSSDVFYLSSARQGTIAKVTRQGNYSVLLRDSTLQSSYGIKMHPNGNRLIVCNGDANFSKYTTPETHKKKGRLITIDILTGKIISEVNLASLIPGKHFPNDLAFDAAGNIYVTDSYAHAIYKVTSGGQASVFCRDKQFVTEGIGINGIVYHPDGYLLVNNTNTGSLYKVLVNDPTNVAKVKTEQYFLDADGMLLDDTKNVTMVVNGGNDKIYRLTSGDGWKSAKLTASTLIADRFTYPTTATTDAQSIWISNGKFHELNDSTAIPSKLFSIQKAVLKPLP